MKSVQPLRSDDCLLAASIILNFSSSSRLDNWQVKSFFDKKFSKFGRIAQSWNWNLTVDSGEYSRCLCLRVLSMYFPITYRRVATARRIMGGTVVIWVITLLLTIPTAYYVKGYNYNLVAKQVNDFFVRQNFDFAWIDICKKSDCELSHYCMDMISNQRSNFCFDSWQKLMFAARAIIINLFP